MTGPEVLIAAVSIVFTGGVLAFLYRAVRKIPRSFANPEQAAHARMTAPYHRLDGASKAWQRGLLISPPQIPAPASAVVRSPRKLITTP